MRRTYVAACLVIFAIITRAERICRQTKIVRTAAASNLRRLARSLHFRRSAASIVARPKPPQSVDRDSVSEIRPFSTRCNRGAHILKGSVVGPKSRRLIVADERTPRSARFLSKDRGKRKHANGDPRRYLTCRLRQVPPMRQGMCRRASPV